MDKLRIMWICNFSNPSVRSMLHLKRRGIDFFVRRLFKKKDLANTDYGIWNTNGINEIKHFQEIELFVVSPHANLNSMIQGFELEGVHYYFYKEQANTLFYKIKKRFINNSPAFNKSRSVISAIVKKVNPDLIHIIGAENPSYSLSALDIPHDKPLIVQLQTLLNDPKIRDKGVRYPEYVLQCERKVIERADFLGFSETDSHFKRVIEEHIIKGKRYLNLELPNGLTVQFSQNKKNYDFVYFAANIQKSFDLALEAFILAHKKNSSITMDVIGHYDIKFKKSLDKIILANNLQNCIHFEGHQNTYGEVLDLVRKCKIALLPLKVDLISSTIRESMALGLPVVSTITPGTPELNCKRESVLLSEIGDHKKMAENMLRLVDDDFYFNTIRDNAALTIKELFDNTATIKEWVKTYKTLLLQN